MKKACLLMILFLVGVYSLALADEAGSVAAQPTVSSPDAAVSSTPVAVPHHRHHKKKPKAVVAPVAVATPIPETQCDMKTCSACGDSSSPFYITLGTGIDIPAQNWQSAYSLGSGLKAGLGYQFCDSWAVEVDFDNFYFSGTTSAGSISDYELRILPEIRYSFEHLFEGSDIYPYVFAGTGLDLEFAVSQTGNNVTVSSYDLVGGLGVEWKLMRPQTYLFLEAKWNFIVASGPNNSAVTGQDIPVLTGVRFGL